MDIAIHGKGMDVGESLRTHAQAKMVDIKDKYLGQATHTTITFSREGHGHGLFRAHIFVLIGNNVTINVEAQDPDAYGAFEKAAEKAAKRWRRYKRRVKEDHRRSEVALVKARDVVLSTPLGRDDSPENEEEEAALDPVIVAERMTDIDVMSVAQATARLDLSGQGAFLFRSVAHGGLNMVYRRTDGHVGWVDFGGMVVEEEEGHVCCGGGGCGGGGH